MKSEDLYNAVTNVKDEYIIEADSHKFTGAGKRVIRICTSIAALFVIGLSIYLLPGMTKHQIAADEAANTISEDYSNGAVDEVGYMSEVMEEKASITSSLQESNSLLLAPTAPQMAKAPAENFDDYESYKKEKEVWSESISKLRKSESMIATDSNSFSSKIVKSVLGKADSDNKIVSPINVYFALGMLAEVTDGNSRQQILDVLNEESIDKLEKNAVALWENNYMDDGIATCKLGASVWLSNRYSYINESLNKLKDYYYASSFSGAMGSKEYNILFQNWLNENTGNMLNEQISGIGFDTDTLAALATTVYFKDSWMDSFNERLNTSDIFHAASGDQTVTFMNQTGHDTLFTGSDFTAVEKRMNDNFTMSFILPGRGVSPEDLLENEEAMAFILSKTSSAEADSIKKTSAKINLSIPKFDVDYQVDIINYLIEMGITDVFSCTTSDFGNLTKDTDDIAVSDILHGTRVKIDEDGCEAAAYTVITMKNTAIMEESVVDFVVDRPFVFVIRNYRNQPLFVGIVNTLN